MEKDEMFMSCCPKCGDVGDDIEICPFCGEKQIRTKYTLFDLLERDDVNDEKIVNEYARCSPLFDEDLYARREGREKILKQATLNRQMEASKNVPKCPKCGSTAITTGARGFSIITGFLGSGQTVNRCGNCGHKWKPRG